MWNNLPRNLQDLHKARPVAERRRSTRRQCPAVVCRAVTDEAWRLMIDPLQSQQLTTPSANPMELDKPPSCVCAGRQMNQRCGAGPSLGMVSWSQASHPERSSSAQHTTLFWGALQLSYVPCNVALGVVEVPAFLVLGEHPARYWVKLRC